MHEAVVHRQSAVQYAQVANRSSSNAGGNPGGSARNVTQATQGNVDFWLPDLSGPIEPGKIPLYQASAPVKDLPEGIQIPYIKGRGENPRQEKKEHDDWVNFHRYQVDKVWCHDKWYDSCYQMVKGELEHSSTVIPCRCGEPGTYKTWPSKLNKLNNMS